MTHILFDIGGSKTRVTNTTGTGSFAEPIVIGTIQEFEDGVRALGDTIEKVSGGKPIEGIVGGFPGPKSGHDKMFRAPNLPSWSDQPLSERLRERFDVPVIVENDASLAALGEASFGFGKGKRSVVYITVSTGVGGGLVVDGKIDESGLYGFEPGWQIIDASGKLCDGCEPPGYLERYVSGRNVEIRFGKKPYEITDKAFWDEIARYLAYGLYNVMVFWSPEVIVLGGSMFNEIGIAVADVEKHLRALNTIFPDIPELKKTELGDSVTLYGALALAAGIESSA
ncbi:MAG: hypothetical protein COW88_00655 [Candidatus Lloydbacteria bacterium CG22_combo_CG10-13_8_21_14_all_47_15]|uniref:ROK family protein n=1 Tax=Candidatus Lloydbacteria bacterium CG22_combo_CG10-13_8_21_14_all_47_15 TaxID=1974635 RepID=A0A2H0CVU8_9BACT|nr:MAG: hypothetical protein COW88_00655 [Candidatus Lloydbacteria bacterium CG22_combo_CG10-13_8_21_14_all_47_15]